jgi:hypothetical protein
MHTMEWSVMLITEQLARERTRSNLKEAEQLRCVRRLRTLRRAQRIEQRAERRMVEAWRRTASLREVIESADY